jgi:hypothetical protein
MRITKVRLKQRAVVIEYENEGETHSVTSRDVPLPSFVAAVANLSSLVLDILHLPKDYAEGLKSTGLTMVETQEVELVCIVATKELPECHSPFNIATPLRFLEHPKEEGSYSPALGSDQVAAVQEVVAEAKKYVKGERAQGQLPLEPEADEGEPDPAPEGDVLEFGAENDNGTPQPVKQKRTRKAKA